VNDLVTQVSPEDALDELVAAFDLVGGGPRLLDHSPRVHEPPPDEAYGRLQDEERDDRQHDHGAQREQCRRVSESGHARGRLLFVEGHHSVHLAEVGPLSLENPTHGALQGGPVANRRRRRVEGGEQLVPSLAEGAIRRIDASQDRAQLGVREGPVGVIDLAAQALVTLRPDCQRFAQIATRARDRPRSRGLTQQQGILRQALAEHALPTTLVDGRRGDQQHVDQQPNRERARQDEGRYERQTEEVTAANPRYGVRGVQQLGRCRLASRACHLSWRVPPPKWHGSPLTGCRTPLPGESGSGGRPAIVCRRITLLIGLLPPTTSNS
jgi:hypothetical protein